MGDNKAKSKASRGGFPLIFGGPGAIDLLNGYKFKTASSSTLDYPQVASVKLGQQAALTSLAVPPALAATSVPRNVQLELGFSLPMDQTSVKNSTLRITDVTGNDASGHWQTDNGGNWSLDIQVQQAIDDGLITLFWKDASTVQLALIDGGSLTGEVITGGTVSHTLVAGNIYKLQ